MGLISAIGALGGILRPATDLTRVLRADKSAAQEMDHAWRKAVLDQLSAEFEQPRTSFFDCLVDGLNRLPRPALALGTLGLFVFAMADPIGFASRMQGLQLVPDQLWWLLGAIVSFYFGARELHYFRDRRPNISVGDVETVARARDALDALRPTAPQGASAPLGMMAAPSAEGLESNPALADWQAANPEPPL